MSRKNRVSPAEAGQSSVPDDGAHQSPSHSESSHRDAHSRGPAPIPPPHYRPQAFSGHRGPSTAQPIVPDASDHEVTWAWQICFHRHVPEEPTAEERSGVATRRAHSQKYETTIARLVEHGLTVEREVSLSGEREFVRIGAVQSQMYEAAEALKLSVPLRHFFGRYRRWEPFRRSQLDTFMRHSDGLLFTPADRVRVIRELIERPIWDGGAGVDMTSKRRSDLIADAFAVHDARVAEGLMRHWVRAPLSALARQPLGEINNYFGAEIALYFAFLGHYTTWLAVPAVLGIIAAVIQYRTTYGSWAVLGFCVVLMVWVAFFLEFWRRRINVLSYEWGLDEFEDTDHERVEFKCKERVGAYIQGTFVPLDDVAAGITDVSKRKQFARMHSVGFYPVWKRKLRAIVASPIVVFFVALVAITTVSLMIARLIVIRNGYWGGSVWMGIANAVVIFLLNQLYARVAMALNRWENHRTEEEFERHLINKVFAFQFVNSYCSLYYIAFFKNSRLFGEYKDRCEPRGDCVADLAVQLISIMTTRQVIGTLLELVIPYISGRLSSVCSKRDAARPKEFERESHRVAFERTVSDYSELTIQFGYVVLFAAAFPLAALFALVNNLIEIRADGFVLLSAYRRPVPMHSPVIQRQWFAIVRLVGFAAVLTNAALMYFTSSTITTLLELSAVGRLLAVILIEHCVFAIQALVDFIIPDNPAWVQRATLEREFAKDLAWQGTFAESSLDESDAPRAAAAELVPAPAPRVSAASAVQGAVANVAAQATAGARALANHMTAAVPGRRRRHQHGTAAGSEPASALNESAPVDV